jgi:hypothetical protein
MLGQEVRRVSTAILEPNWRVSLGEVPLSDAM